MTHPTNKKAGVMKKTIATVAITIAALTGCTLETPVGIPDVEIGDTATLDRDQTPWRITGNDTWRIVSHTVGTVEVEVGVGGKANTQTAGAVEVLR